MNIQLHKNARTPPAIRLELQSQPESVSDREDALREAGAKMPVKPVKAYDPGCVHVDVKYLPQMPDEDHRQYLFAAIDRATRWVYVELLQDKSDASAGGFLTRLIDKAPFTIT